MGLFNRSSSWTITDSATGKSQSFDTREDAASYAKKRMVKGVSTLEVTTPDGRSGSLGTATNIETTPVRHGGHVEITQFNAEGSKWH